MIVVVISPKRMNMVTMCVFIVEQVIMTFGLLLIYIVMYI